MLYNVVLVFAILQHESAIGIHSGRNLCAQMFFFLSFFFFFAFRSFLKARFPEVELLGQRGE